MYLPRSFLGFPAMPYTGSVDIARSGVQRKRCWAFLEIRTVSKCSSRDADKLGAAQPAAEGFWIRNVGISLARGLLLVGWKCYNSQPQNHWSKMEMIS